MLSQCSEIDFSNNPINTIFPSTFDGTINGVYINLANCNLTTLPDGLFQISDGYSM
jgi:hypothetical protein